MRLPVQRRLLGLVALLVGGCLWTACEVIGGKKEATRAINHEIAFRLAEEHDLPAMAPDVPKIFFSMWTKEPFGCAGYRIQHEVVQSAERVTIRITGIEGPDGLCLAVLAPASARRSIPLDPGTYTLVLVNGPLRDTYTVTVTDRQVQIHPDGQRWTKAVASLYWRYPRDSFAYYCEGPTEALCAEFEAHLDDLALTSIEVPKQGVWPYNRNRLLRRYLNAPGQFYHYPDEETWRSVKTRLREFACERERAEMEVRNWRYDGVQSWMVGCGE